MGLGEQAVTDGKTIAVLLMTLIRIWPLRSDEESNRTRGYSERNTELY
jgi:hypothetical protein